jgi:hypothetical protein
VTIRFVCLPLDSCGDEDDDPEEVPEARAAEGGEGIGNADDEDEKVVMEVFWVRDGAPKEFNGSCAPAIHSFDVIFGLFRDSEGNEAREVYGDKVRDVLLRGACVFDTRGGSVAEGRVGDLPEGTETESKRGDRNTT